MPAIAKWRGSSNLTKYWEAIQAFDLAKLSKKDVFYDLGCGYGRVCIWAARRCKFARGIESHRDIIKDAIKNVQKSGLKNVEIIKGDFVHHRFPDADVLYCVTSLNVRDFQRWDKRKRKKNLRIVTLGPPPIPIKPVATKGTFCLTRFPFELAKTSDEWYYDILGKRNGLWKDVVRKFKRALNDESLRSLRRDFKRKFKE